MADTIGAIQTRRQWTKEEDNYIAKRRKQGASFQTIATELHRSKGAVIGRCSRLGEVAFDVIPRGTPWTEAEIEKLVSLHNRGLQIPAIRDLTNRSSRAIEWQLVLLRKSGRIQKQEKKPKAAKAPAKPKKPTPSHKRSRILSGGVLVKKTFSAHSRAEAKAAAYERYTSKFFDRAVKPHMAGLPLENLTPRMCRYACNDADVRNGEEHLFCGEDVVHGKSYCRDHLPLCETLYKRAA